MFARRLPETFSPNALSVRIAQARAAGRSLIDLTETNPTRAGLAPSASELAGALAHAAPAAAAYDPQPAGSLAAREAVARYYADAGVPIEPSQILLTTSTSEAYAHLFRLLADAGDEILVPRPSYPLFEPLAALEAVRLVPYSLHYDGRWRIDVGEIEAACGPRTRAVIVVSPNNPTGSAPNAAERAAISATCAARGVPIIADEVFADFGAERDDSDDARGAGASAGAAAAGRPSFAARSAGLTFTLSGLSKVCGLPQIKLGWIVTSGADPVARDAHARLEWIADAFLSVSAIAEHAAPALLAARHTFQARARGRVEANRAALAAALAARPEMALLACEGGWTAIVRVPRTASEEEWALALLDRDVVVHPGHFYDFAEEAYLVVSLLPEPERFAAGAALLAGALP
jgi:aspartate/methionine/tyrosine aminotransferase